MIISEIDVTHIAIASITRLVSLFYKIYFHLLHLSLVTESFFFAFSFPCYSFRKWLYSPHKNDISACITMIIYAKLICSRSTRSHDDQIVMKYSDFVPTERRSSNSFSSCCLPFSLFSHQILFTAEEKGLLYDELSSHLNASRTSLDTQRDYDGVSF